MKQASCDGFVATKTKDEIFPSVVEPSETTNESPLRTEQVPNIQNK